MTVTATGTCCLNDSVSTRSASCFAMVSRSMVISALAVEAELAHVESELIFRVTRLLQPLLEEGLDSCLRSGSLDGGHAGVPARPDFDVGRQAGFVDETLGVRDRPLVERGDPGCECVHEIVELAIR